MNAFQWIFDRPNGCSQDIRNIQNCDASQNQCQNYVLNQRLLCQFTLCQRAGQHGNLHVVTWRVRCYVLGLPLTTEIWIAWRFQILSQLDYDQRVIFQCLSHPRITLSAPVYRAVRFFRSCQNSGQNQNLQSGSDNQCILVTCCMRKLKLSFADSCIL